MSRRYLALLSIVTLAACGDSSQPLAPVSARTAPTARAAAYVETTVFETPTNVARFVKCANGGLGEVVDYSGTVLRMVHVTENENGFHVTFHANPQQVSGVGRITGDTYQARGTYTSSFNVGQEGGTQTIHDVLKLVGQGPNNNLTVTFEDYHITINANGEVTVLSDENFSAVCS
jgi:hypothetical protein